MGFLRRVWDKTPDVAAPAGVSSIILIHRPRSCNCFYAARDVRRGHC
jgi:hypothetical protein